jgi:hypothetical protein
MSETFFADLEPKAREPKIMKLVLCHSAVGDQT